MSQKKKSKFIESPWEDVLQLRNKSVLIYSRRIIPAERCYSFKKLQAIEKARETAYSGLMSINTRKRIAKACDLLVQSAERKRIYNPVTKHYQYHKLSFITLTITNSTRTLDQKEAYKTLLKPMLQWMIRRKEMKSYLWKAELQNNNQIHYHITTPSFILHTDLRNNWNNLLSKHGLLHEYFKTYGHYNPNSVDIHNVRHVNDMVSYLTKEICKCVQNQKSLNGKVWDCSTNLKGAKYYSTVLTQDHSTFLKMATKEKLSKLIQGERFTLLKFKEEPLPYLLSENEKSEYQQHIQNIRRSPEPMQIA